jgi:hypothetical protein
MNHSFLTKLVRAATSWAWAHEQAVVGGITALEELHMTPGAMEASVSTRPEMKEFMLIVLGGLVAESPNYTEAILEFGKPHPEHGHITVTIQKLSGKTPHQLREEAEVKMKAVLDAVATWVQMGETLITMERVQALVGPLRRHIEALSR